MPDVVKGRPEVQLDSTAPDYRRNYALGLANGMLAQLGNSILHPQLVLAAFVYDQTRSNLLVGLLTALSVAGHRLPQLYVSSLIEHRERKKRSYVMASLMRLAALIALAGAMLLIRSQGGWLPMGLFFLAYVAFRTAQGSASLPFLDIMARTIGPSRVGGFFALRHFLGGVMALLGGFFLVQPVLSYVSSPLSYALLTLLAAGTLTVAWSAVFMVLEPANPDPPKRRGLRQSFAAGRRMLKEQANYRILLYLRVLGHMNGLALVFYVPYGVEKLGVAGISGILLGLISASRMASSLVWGRVSNRRGNRLCLVIAGLFFVLSPTAALAAPLVPDVFQWAVPGTGATLDLPLLLYLLALFCFGFAQQANLIGTQAFTLESAPPERRPSYMAFLNTVTIPMTFLPALAGVLVAADVMGLSTLFGLVAVSGLLTLALSLRLAEVRRAPAG